LIVQDFVQQVEGASIEFDIGIVYVVAKTRSVSRGTSVGSLVLLAFGIYIDVGSPPGDSVENIYIVAIGIAIDSAVR